MPTSLDELAARLRDFADRREWGRFHTPNNLALALVGEVGELAAELQWLNDDEVAAALQQRDLRERLSDEMADVLIYLVRFADVCGVDLLEAANAKVDRNEARYPVERVRGSAAKYNELDE